MNVAGKHADYLVLSSHFVLPYMWLDKSNDLSLFAKEHYGGNYHGQTVALEL